jgi:dienelactone hydrolase
MSISDALQPQADDNSVPRYQSYGWEQWPEHAWLSYQFRRTLGYAQLGGASVSECMQVASRVVPADKESWHAEWMRVADRNSERAEQAEKAGDIFTARAAWLRASSYYRSAEFRLTAEDPRRAATFERCETTFMNAGRYFSPKLERVKIPYDNGKFLHSYFIGTPHALNDRQPVLIAMGGLDSFKEELYFIFAQGALERGISCLLLDGPGQGATVRREGIHARPDVEVAIAACIDYLNTREDVDQKRIALAGTSLGGHFVSRAGSKEHRLAAVAAQGVVWDINKTFKGRPEDFPSAHHAKSVFGASTVAEAVEIMRPFTLEGVLEEMRCPYLLVHGANDVLGAQDPPAAAEYARRSGVNITYREVTAEETGADHCQHDNPTLGSDIIADWLAHQFGIDQAALLKG